jgi:hypothetical protein
MHFFLHVWEMILPGRCQQLAPGQYFFLAAESFGWTSFRKTEKDEQRISPE